MEAADAADACFTPPEIARAPVDRRPHIRFRVYSGDAGRRRTNARPGVVRPWPVLSALERHGVETQAVFVPAGENPDRLVYVLTTAETAQAMDAGWAGLAADPAWQEVVAETDSDGPLVVAEDGERLVTTAWSPPFIAERAGTPRIFERRTYACPDPAKHAALLQRFHNHTMALFAKHGMQNVVYWVPTTPAASEHRLVYLLGHESEAAAKKSFSAFRKDAGWLAAKKESEERAGGSLTNADKGVVSEFLEATDYSPLR